LTFTPAEEALVTRGRMERKKGEDGIKNYYGRESLNPSSLTL